MASPETQRVFSDLTPWDTVPQEMVDAFPIVMGRDPSGPLARSLGYYLFHWSVLEQAVFTTLLKIVAMDDLRDFGAFVAVTAGTDIYKRAETLTAIASMNNPETEWFSRLKKTEQHITGTLREQRNRIVHDFWSLKQDEIVQTLMRARVDKNTGRPKLLHAKPVTLDDISLAAIGVMTTSMYLRRLCDEYDAARGAK